MVKVCIERQLLPVADMLIDIFAMRMAEIGIREDVAAKPAGTVRPVRQTRVAKSREAMMCSYVVPNSLRRMAARPASLIWQDA